jgi:rod shape determining protein RodA
MTSILIPTFFLFLFSFFTLFGIRIPLARTQLFYFLAGLVAFVVVKKLGRRMFQFNTKFFYWFFVFLLIGTFIIGLEVKGSKRWIDLYLFNFQASEFFKVFFILFFARQLSKHVPSSQAGGLFLRLFFYMALPVFIIFKQPDLGNAMVYVFLFIVLILFSRIPRSYLFSLIGAGAALIPFMWFFLKDYQRNRILSFVSPHLETQGNAYNMIQAMITIGSGQWLGRGLGLGTQSRLFFLPENNTDFAFASLVEQFGFAGGFVVIILYAVIAVMLFSKLIKYVGGDDEESRFKFLYTLGILSYILFQAFVNIGMNLGVLPIAGIALPFISYGGSLPVTLMVGFALLP